MNLYTFISNWLALLSPHATDAIWLKEQEAVLQTETCSNS